MMLFNFVSLVLCLLVAVGVAVPRPVSRRSQKSSLLLNVRDAGTDASDALGLPSSISDSLQTVTSVYSSSSFNHSLSLDISPSSQQGSPTVSSETSSRSLIPTSAPPVPSSSAHAVLSLPAVTSTPSSVTQPLSSAPVPSLSSPVSQSTASIPSAASSSPTTSETASSPPASSPLLPSLSSATKTSLPQTAPIETSASQSSSNLASSSSSSGSSVLSDASASFSAAQPSVPVSSSISVPVPSASSLSAPLTSVATSASSGLTTSISTTAPVSASTSVQSSASVSASSLTSASATASSGTPSSSRVPFPSPTTGPAEIAAYVDGHNKARFLAGSRPLSWDGALADLAKSYASQCRFQHSDGALGPFGENLVAGTGIFSAEAAVAQFISDGPSGKDEFTHWSQVVWKATTRLGCGVALCDHIFDQPATYHVCLYDPVGNVVGELQTNL